MGSPAATARRRTSATGCSDRCTLVVRQTGFTLIELLVALAILAIGLTAGIGLLRPDPRQPLNTELERLALLLEHAAEESELSGTPIAWLALENGYAFERQMQGVGGVQWRPLTDDPILRPRQFPHGFLWQSLSADGRSVVMGGRHRLDARGPAQLALSLVYGEARGQVRFSQGMAYAQAAQMVAAP